VLHLALFVPWEDFLHEIPEDFSVLWKDLAENLSPRLKFNVKNISLLRKSADDAKTNVKLWKSHSDGDDVVAAEFEEPLDTETATETDDILIEECNFTAFRKFLQHAVQTGEATEKSQPFLQMLQTTNLAAGDFLKFYSTSSETRTGDFYNEIQHNEEQGIGIANLQASQITSLCKAQKILDQNVIDRINGYDSEESTEATPSAGKFITLGPGSKLQVQTGSFESYIDAALYIVDIWAMNKLQSQALLQPFEFLQRYKTGEYEQEEPQYFNYIGGAGGTGKSRVIDAFRDVFRVKDCEKEILITASSGSAAAKILGVTVHSALGIGINDKKVNGTVAASTNNQIQQRCGISEKQLKKAELWVSRSMLIIDEISMISGAVLNEIDIKCRNLGDRQRLFGGIPVIVFSGDFCQFPPVGGLSLITIGNKAEAVQVKSQSLQNHLRGYNIFQKFTKVVILRQQVRAAKCPILLGFLSRLRNGEQTAADYEMLQARRIQAQDRDFTTGMRAITPTNRTKQLFNIEAALQWCQEVTLFEVLLKLYEQSLVNIVPCR